MSKDPVVDIQRLGCMWSVQKKCIPGSESRTFSVEAKLMSMLAAAEDSIMVLRVMNNRMLAVAYLSTIPSSFWTVFREHKMEPLLYQPNFLRHF